jgi:hypothetical protein
VAWNNFFQRIFNECWRESVDPLLYYCNELPLTYFNDMRKLNFYKKLLRTLNSIMLTLLNVAHPEINAICAKCSFILHRHSIAVIKDRIWRSFVENDSFVFF